MKDRNIYFKIGELSIDFCFQGIIIKQCSLPEEAITYIRRKKDEGYTIKPYQEALDETSVLCL